MGKGKMDVNRKVIKIETFSFPSSFPQRSSCPQINQWHAPTRSFYSGLSLEQAT